MNSDSLMFGSTTHISRWEQETPKVLSVGNSFKNSNHKKDVSKYKILGNLENVINAVGSGSQQSKKRTSELSLHPTKFLNKLTEDSGDKK